MQLRVENAGMETSHRPVAECLSKANEAASNINALLIAKGKLKPSQLGRSQIPKKPQPVKKRFDAEVEINDAPIICRDILTRNSNQEEISKKSGAFISTKGRYISPEQRGITDVNRERPLYLYIQAETEENVQRAIGEINQVILSHGGIVNQTRGSTISVAAPLVEYNQLTHQNHMLPVVSDAGASGLSMIHTPQQPPNLSQPPPSVAFITTQANTTPQIHFLEEKIFIGLEHAPPTFDVREKVLGTKGSFLQHIHSTSGAVVTLRGRNSGYLNPETGQESTEPMHIHLKHMSQEGLEEAKRLANDLIRTVQLDYSQFQRQLALQPPISQLSHRATGIVSFIPRQSGTATGILGYQPQEQRVIMSSAPAMSAAAPPLSIMMSQESTSQVLNYSLSRPPTYVQAVPPPLYNSLISKDVELVRQTLPTSRPLTSIIQPLIMEGASGEPPSMATSHQVSMDTPPSSTIIFSDTGTPVSIQSHVHEHSGQAVPVSIHYNSMAQPIVITSQPHPHAMTSHFQPQTVIAGPGSLLQGHPPPNVITSQPPPMFLTTESMLPPDMVSRPPPAMTHSVPPNMTSHPPQELIMSYPPPATIIAGHHPQPVMTSHPPPVIIANHAAVPIMSSQSMSESHLVFVSQPQQTVYADEAQVPIFSVPGAPTAVSVMREVQPEGVTYIMQQPPMETQLVRIDQPDLSMPPPTLLTEGPPPTHQPIQPVAVNGYGQPVEVVEIIQTQPHHLPPRQAATLHIQQAQHSECHTAVHGVGPGTAILHSVPRYPLPLSSTAGTIVPSLMDMELQNSAATHAQAHRPLSSLPPIEPPPHLADGYQSNKRQYPDDRQYYPAQIEHRPPYIGSGRPYSALSPPPPPTHPNQTDGQPRHKRRHNEGQPYPPPPPPPPV